MHIYLQILCLLCHSFALFAQEVGFDDDHFSLIDFKEEILTSIQPTQHEHPADTDPLDLTLSAECEPLTTVAGCVNVLSGRFFQIEKDLKGNTIVIGAMIGARHCNVDNLIMIGARH